MAFDPIRFYRPSTYGFGGGGSGKEARRQEDIARQAQESTDIFYDFLRQLPVGSPEYNEFLSLALDLVRRTDEPGDQQDEIRRLGQRFVSQFGARVGAGGAATPFEQRTDLAFEDLRKRAAFRPEEQDIFDALRGTSEGELTPAGDIFANLVARTRDSEKFFHSTLDPQLQLAEQMVRQRAASRGTLGAGLELEDLGRTGAELSIREAEALENFRQRQLENFWGLFGQGQQLREREIGIEQQRFGTQFAREGSLQAALNALQPQMFDQGFSRAKQNVGFARNDVATQRMLEEQRRQELMELAQLAGTVAIGAGTGGAGLPAGAAGSFAALSTGRSAPINAQEILALNRAGLGGNVSPRGGRQDLRSFLSRQPLGYN